MVVGSTALTLAVKKYQQVAAPYLGLSPWWIIPPGTMGSEKSLLF